MGNTTYLVLDYLLPVYHITITAAIHAAAKNKLRNLSALAIIFSITIPITSLSNSIGRDASTNELEHLLSQLQQGAFWAIFEVIGYIYLLTWWVLILLKNRKM
jgi:hypothetical protein